MKDRFKFRVWDKVFNIYWPYEDIKGNIAWLLFPDNDNIHNVEIEQCTGLKDKDGKLIYESDYVSDGKNTYKVFWNNTKISLVNILKNDILDIENIGTLIEVIGNEHEEGNFR